ncbi:MAG: ABC transporter ATP-binding protein [Desulfamplus sp.]|nr:ABC transporter ATP-binding protein [Desulfamplus sp.]MBF0242253.1 ABC transporter ATP-binding protein [Desulfamplus sp.]
MKNIFELKNIEHIYNNRKALDIEYLSISQGSITGLIGPNGSGKTTLLKLLAFAMRPTTGTILFNGKVQYPFSKNVRFKVTLLTQKPYLLKRSVYDNIKYGLTIRQKNGIGGNSDKEIRIKVETAMSYVGLDFNLFAQRGWDELSGGEAQRVAMAARLVLKPDVLLLDEPTASVDINSAKLIRDSALKSREEWGTTVVVASHDRSWLDDVCETNIHLLNGSNVAKIDSKIDSESL